jgi:hypothetical protein
MQLGFFVDIVEGEDKEKFRQQIRVFYSGLRIAFPLDMVILHMRDEHILQ